MLDSRNSELLIQIAKDKDTTSATRVYACALLNRLAALPAKEILAILQDTIDDPITKSGVQVKAMDLIDKINSSTGQEPELSSEDEELVKTKLMEKYLVCPNTTSEKY